MTVNGAAHAHAGDMRTEKTKTWLVFLEMDVNHSCVDSCCSVALDRDEEPELNANTVSV